MASTNLGDQLITFRYQQEGTSKGFNELLCGVLPEGVISGGELTKANDFTVQIEKMHMLIGDGDVVVHVQTREIISLAISSERPYIVASFNWSQSINNYVNFEAKSFNELNLMSHPIILGKGVYNGENLGTEFDYTRKTKCPFSYYTDFFYDFGYPSFNVSPIENRGERIGFVVGKGKAIINGKMVEKISEEEIILQDNDENYHKINLTIETNKARIDIAVLMNDGSIRYIMGEQASSPKPPIYPSNGLVIAEFKYTTSITPSVGITGNNIKNIYNNNYMSFSPTVGEMKGGTLTKQHVLYL